jgi:hypothetical protein
MRIFKTRTFQRWATRAGLTDEALADAVSEMERGLIDADLGGNLYKKRVALPGRGKSGSTRTLVATRFEGRLFFLYGFEKNERENISSKEEDALKLAGSALLGLDAKGLARTLEAGTLLEVKHEKKPDH